MGNVTTVWGVAGASRGRTGGLQARGAALPSTSEIPNCFQQEAQHFHCVPDPASDVVSAGVQIQLLTLRSWIALQEHRLAD